MAQAADHAAAVTSADTSATSAVSDYDAICRVAQLCTEGEARGDAAKLREAFHTDARMFGSIAGTRYDVPIAELFALAESAPADTGKYRSRVLSVQQTGDAAVAVVAEEGYWGTVSFIDYLLLARIDGAWKIVCKLFAHTAGDPPEGI
jgi:Putative lumazine-binding